MMERRIYKRAFFTFKDNIPITVIKTGKDSKTIPATLLSISKGGVSFVAKRHEVKRLKVGDKLTIFCACLPEPVNTIKSIGIEVKYIIDFDSYAQVAIGCKFAEISESILENIQQLVQIKSKILDD